MLRGVLFAMFLSTLVLGGAERTDAEKEKKPSKPFKIAVMDFTSIDIQGQKFYQYKPAPPPAAKTDSLNTADRFSIDRKMQGLVKMIDAQASSWQNYHENMRREVENDRARERREKLAGKIMNSPRRNIVIGSEFMIAAMGKYPETMTPVNRANIDRALAEIDFGASLTDDPQTLSKFTRISGADYLLYVTAADFQTRERRFKGYGVETANTEYVLDLVYKLVDLRSGAIVASGAVSGVSRELKTPYLEEINSDRFKDLMKNGATKIAAELDGRILALTAPAGEKSSK